MVEEKVDNRRSFVGPDGETKYFITAPTAEGIRGADWNYSKTYTNSLVEGGITTIGEMMDILRIRRIIGPEFEQRAAELTDNLNNLIVTLNVSNSNEEKRELSLAVANAREELFQWNQRLNGPIANTCEQLADDSRLEFLAACMVQNEEGERVWEKYEDYLAEKNQGLVMKSRFEVMLFLQGLDSDFLDKTPEAIAMREVEADILQQAEAIEKMEKVVGSEEPEPEVIKEVLKEKNSGKKTTTRKTTPAKSK